MAESLNIAKYCHLEAEISGQIVTHKGYRSNPQTGERRVKFEESWRRGRFLGHGASGTVMLEENVKDNSRVRAVKILTKHREPSGTTDPFDEAAVMAVLSRSQNDALFVNFSGWYETHDSICLVMEYIKFGDLDHHLYVHGALQEPDVSDIAKQILEGLEVIHHAGFIHRDLKPSNILIQHISPWWVKIGDFGISKRLRDESTITLTGCGTNGYKAPEVSFNERTHHTTAVDMWSLGCITYKALVDQLPFATDYDVSDFRHNTHAFSQKLDAFERLSSEVKVFLNSLIVTDPRQRAIVDVALKLAWIMNPPLRSDMSIRPHAKAGHQCSTNLSDDKCDKNGSQQLDGKGADNSYPVGHRSSRNHDETQLSHHLSHLSLELSTRLSQAALDLVLLRRRAYFPHDDEEALRHFVQTNDVEVVSLLLDQDTHVDTRYKSNVTPLMYAATLGHEKMVQLLLDRGADVDAKDRTGSTSLSAAVTHNHPQVVRALPLRDIDLDVKDQYGYPLLARAAMNGHKQLVRTLIDKGADVEVRDKDGSTPLVWAIVREHHHVVRFLLERGADVNAGNHLGRTPFMYICDKMHHHIEQGGKSDPEVEIMELLLERGADVNARDNTGCTALLSSIRCYLGLCKSYVARSGTIVTEKQLHQCQKVYVRLLNKAVNVNLKDNEGHTPLTLIVRDEVYCTTAFTRVEHLIDRLLDRGADTNDVAANGLTALMFAVRQKAEALCTLLLKRRADVNMKNRKGQTALMCAATQGSSTMCRLLLDEGADPNLQDNDGHSALTHAASLSDKEHACSLLLDRGAGIEISDNKGRTALMIASSNGCQEICTLLLRSGADIHAKDELGWTALMHAIHNDGNPKICEQLLTLDATVNLQDRNGWTPLMLATQAGSGAKVPLAVSRRHQFVNKFVWLLIQYGARLDLQNSDNKTAYDIAKELDYFSCGPLFSLLLQLLPPPPPQSSTSEKLKYKLRRLDLGDLIFKSRKAVIK